MSAEENKTLSRRITALKNFFRWLQQQHILTHNPAENLSHTRPTPPLPEILTEHECQRLLTAAETGPREHIIILLLLQLGLKKAELLHVEQRDYEFDREMSDYIFVLLFTLGFSCFLFDFLK